jgi:hypothetical protein
MTRRPKLSDQSFLGHLFSPRKYGQPTGIRKTTLKGTQGQKKGRIAAFNRMLPFKQELLKRSGTRDSYLRGETTLADAKTALRPKGIAAGVAKPVRGSQKPVRMTTDLDRRIERYLKIKLPGNVEKYNPRTIEAQNPFLGDMAEEGMLRWDLGEIKYAGREGSEYETVDANGVTHNPFWYH